MLALQDMAKHKGLSAIAALDTFIANGDRHHGNFFYEQQTDTYYVIDLEAAFDKNLASYACTFIESIIMRIKQHKKIRADVRTPAQTVERILLSNKRKTITEKELAA